MNLMSVSQYAKHAGMSRQALYTWESKSGFPARVGSKIDAIACDAYLSRYRDSHDPRAQNAKSKPVPAKGNRLGNKSDGDPAESPAKIVEKMIAGNGIKMTIDEAREMKENFLALLTRLEYEIKSGQVLPYKDMIEAVGGEYSRMRTRLIAIAPEHGPRLRVLASTTNDAEFVAALQEVVYEAMEELSLDNNNNGESG